MSALQTLARRWWAGELGAAGAVLGLLLAPAEAAYRVGVAARNRGYRHGLRTTHRGPVPVISVGNIAVGGTGKTPLAHWLAVRLRQRGQVPAILHGGYAADEPALHRLWSPAIPVVVGRDRVAAVHRAAAGGATVVVLDDGFQHRRLQRDLDIVLVSAEGWTRPDRLLPRGPWREPRSALRRADAIVVTRKTAPGAVALQVASELSNFTTVPVMRVHLHATGWQLAGATEPPPVVTAAAPDPTSAANTVRPPGPTRPALLVSGVAEPGLFVESARGAGADVAGVLTFPDHHPYSRSDADRIRTMAAGRPVVTTEKDWTRLARWLTGDTVWLLRQAVIFESGLATLDALLEQVLS